ncbi:MAG: putative deoxyribonuclease YcfH [Ignavibacteriae bacterium]|nr:MAG: putative deoxyribonuclease YcfH [Ignavibacteriota bacterium]
MFIDTHAHLNSDEYNKDLDEVIKRAIDSGVEFIVVPGTDLATSQKAIELADKYDIIYAAVGFHPHEAQKADDYTLSEIEKLSQHSKVVAIGEIGLDYHYNFSPSEIQKDIFKKQIEIAQKRNLPIIIHQREAEADTLNIVRDAIHQNPLWRKNGSSKVNRFPAPRGVFHSFSSDAATAWKVIKLGFYISLPGIVTFKTKRDTINNSHEVLKKVSIEHILLETDSPYLTPEPFRGKRNEPAYIKFIAEKIAEIQDLSVEDIGRTSNLGAYKLFEIGKYPEPTYVYKIRNSLYLNITLRCNADCWFCDRKGEALVKGYNLKIMKEPTSEEIISAIGDPKKFEEIVFCGFGEPTIRLDVIKQVGSWIKQNGGKVRLNTDGHGNVINHRNIIPELVGIVDSVSISLNSIDPKQYGEMMRINPDIYFPAMVEFAKEAVKYIGNVTMTIVDLTGADEIKAKSFVEKEIGAKFRNRPYF